MKGIATRSGRPSDRFSAVRHTVDLNGLFC